MTWTIIIGTGQVPINWPTPCDIAFIIKVGLDPFKWPMQYGMDYKNKNWPGYQVDPASNKHSKEFWEVKSGGVVWRLHHQSNDDWSKNVRIIRHTQNIERDVTVPVVDFLARMEGGEGSRSPAHISRVDLRIHRKAGIFICRMWNLNSLPENFVTNCKLYVGKGKGRPEG